MDLATPRSWGKVGVEYGGGAEARRTAWTEMHFHPKLLSFLISFFLYITTLPRFRGLDVRCVVQNAVTESAWQNDHGFSFIGARSVKVLVHGSILPPNYFVTFLACITLPPSYTSSMCFAMITNHAIENLSV